MPSTIAILGASGLVGRAIIDGKLIPFAGPLKDNAGATQIGPGAALTHEQLMAINWYVDGVDGSVPQ